MTGLGLHGLSVGLVCVGPTALGAWHGRAEFITLDDAGPSSGKIPLRMKRRPTLISPPLDWQMSAVPVGAPVIPVIAERGGTQLKTPLPVLLVDTREQNPFDFSPFAGWFSGIKEKALKLGDYSVAGLEDVCVVERKGLGDLVSSCTSNRAVFVKRLKRMARVPHRLLVITSALSEVKSEYGHGGNPNRVTVVGHFK